MTDVIVPGERLRLITFGGLSIQSEGGAQIPGTATRRQSMALLAFLASERSGSGVSRDRLCAIFWPESDTEHARNALKQTIFSLRRDLRQPELVTGTTEIRLNREVICSDIADFTAALAARDFERASRIYTGAFLEGIHLRNAPEFERWAENERSRRVEEADMAMRAAAKAAIARGDSEQGVLWWRRVAALHPLDTAATLELMQALALRGDSTGAIRQAKVHSTYVREELGADPDPRVTAMASKLAAPPSPVRDVANGKARTDAVVATAPAAAKSSPSAPDESKAPPIGSNSRLMVGGVAGALMILSIWFAVERDRNAAAAPTRPPSAIFIAPFHVDHADPTLAFLHEGMIDLLGSTMVADSLSPRIVDPAAVLAFFREPRAKGAADPSLPQILERAIKLGAARVVSGKVVRTGSDVFLSASVLQAGTGQSLGTAKVSGKLDSLPRLVDQLAAQLAAIQMGEKSVTPELLSGTPLTAVKAYLSGRAALRRGAYAESVLQHKLALVSDSTFALAALELGRAAGWLGDDAARRMAYERAYANRKKLRPLDQAVVTAMLGPNYPKGSTRGEWLAAWEHVAELRPDEPEGWYEAGDLLFHNPWLNTATDREGLARAALFFSRALDRAPDYVPALQHLLQLAAHDGDTATVRRIASTLGRVHTSPDLEVFLNWRSAVALGDSASIRNAWARFQPGNLLALQWVAMTSEEDGVARNEAAGALRARLQRASTDRERVDAFLSRHALALNRGDLRTVSEVLETLESTRLGSDAARDLRILDALYGGVPVDEAVTEAIDHIETTARPGPSGSSAEREQWSVDRCILGHWYLWNGDNAKVTRQSTMLNDVALSHTKELWSDGASTCALLLNTFVATRENKPGAVAMRRSLERRLASGAYMTSRLLWDITVIASARLFELSGDIAAAEHAARRRNWFYRWPHFLAPQLYELGRIAHQRGDTATARDAYAHYLALRDSPHPAFRPQVEKVRAAYASISK